MISLDITVIMNIKYVGGMHHLTFLTFFSSVTFSRLICFTRIIRLVLELHTLMPNWFMYYYANLNQAVNMSISIRPYTYPSQSGRVHAYLNYVV